MIRGANRQDIFHDNEDRSRFLETLNNVKITSEIKVYGWCLMNNHVHDSATHVRLAQELRA